MGLSLPARAGYDASRRHSRSGREGASLPAPDPKPRWSPAGRAQPFRRGAVPSRGQERGESTAERARASGSAIREARERSRGSSRSEHDAATERARSGGVAGLPQTSPNVTRVTTPVRALATPSAEPTPATPSERRAASELSSRPSAADRVVRAPVVCRRTCAPCRVRRRASSDVRASA